MGQDVINGPLDLLGYWGSDRQMSALRVEAVLVGGVADGDGSAVRGGVLELALSDDRGLTLGSYRLRRALLGNGDAVLRLVVVVVRSFRRDVLRLLKDRHHRVRALLGRDDGDQSERYDLKRKK